MVSQPGRGPIPPSSAHQKVKYRIHSVRRLYDYVRYYNYAQNEKYIARSVAGREGPGVQTPQLHGPEATREIRANPVGNALWGGHTLLALCVSVSGKFAERETHDVKMHYFPLKCMTQIGNTSAWVCTAHMRETAFLILHFINLQFKFFSHWGCAPGHWWRTSIPRPPEMWTPAATKTQLRPCI